MTKKHKYSIGDRLLFLGKYIVTVVGEGSLGIYRIELPNGYTTVASEESLSRKLNPVQELVIDIVNGGITVTFLRKHKTVIKWVGLYQLARILNATILDYRLFTSTKEYRDGIGEYAKLRFYHKDSEHLLGRYAEREAAKHDEAL